MKKELLGEISNYFKNISVAAFVITNGKLKVGDNIQIKGSTTDFTIKVESIQLEHKSIEVAKSGDDIGIKVDQKARRGDKVYLIQKD